MSAQQHARGQVDVDIDIEPGSEPECGHCLQVICGVRPNGQLLGVETGKYEEAVVALFSR